MSSYLFVTVRCCLQWSLILKHYYLIGLNMCWLPKQWRKQSFGAPKHMSLRLLSTWLPKRPNWKYFIRGLLRPKKQTKQTKGKIVPLVMSYHPGVKNLKQILMQKWNLIKNQPLNGCSFAGIFLKPRWNNFATFFFLLTAVQDFFSISFVLHAIFFLPTIACRKFFSKSPTPTLKSKWSAP